MPPPDVAAAASCTDDSGCSTGQYCLETAIQKHVTGGVTDAQTVKECTGAGDTCVCNHVKSCSSDADCTASTKCLNSTGTASTGGACLCQTDAVYTGVCGPANANWTASVNQIPDGGSNYVTTFRNACPAAYSFQFDDQASDMTCYATADQVPNYTVTFCGS